ncbi:MAG TPA: ribonuclease E/G [Azospirillaceae bacterium]|nr:ribonuclease E/G [Azospirillaceae bacterium]
MAKRMLVDATHPEETRVVVVNGNKLEELDFEIASRKQLKGNIYLAKVIRVEPSLQAAFVEYGGNRHGFLAFSEIHPDYYRIPVADREALIREQEAYERERAARYDHEDEAEEAGETAADTVRTADTSVAAEPAGAPSDSQADAAADVGAEGESPLAAPAEEAPAPVEAAPAAEDAPAADAAPEAAGDEPAPKPKRRRTRKTSGGGDSERQLSSTEGVVETLEESDDDHHDQNGDEDEGEEQGNGRGEGHGQRRPRSLRSYKIQEVIRRRQILLVQVTKEERGTKGAALTTYLSLPGRYCVLMPNTPRGGGISRKITNPQDRKRLKELLEDLNIPNGMAVILRTAGMERTKQEIKRDLEYLMRLWDNIREQTMQSVAPALIYEEANLIKRSIRDLYSGDLDDVLVEGEEGYRTAKEFMRMLMPSHAKNVQAYREPIPLFHRYQVESQIETMFNPVVQLKSGGYIVINQTEALVAIDVNSGRATKERNIEETALRTNMEAAEEVARQLRLRDLAGLIVIDFIDMEESRNNASVEKRLKEAMKQDRARIQLGRISGFGLLELSRQRLRPSLQEINFERCPHCVGSGMIRSVESAALVVLRAIEEEGIRRRSAEITVTCAPQITLYILNQKRDALAEIERRYAFRVYLQADESLIPPDHRLERIRARSADEPVAAAVDATRVFHETDRMLERQAAAEQEDEAEEEVEETAAEGRPERPAAATENGDRERNGRRRRRRRRGRNGEERGYEERNGEQSFANGDEGDAEGDETGDAEGVEAQEGGDQGADAQDANGDEFDENGNRKKRRRGKRGGRRRSRNRLENGLNAEGGDEGGDETGDESGDDDTYVAAEPAAPEAVAEAAAPVVETVSEPVADEAPAPKKRASRSRKKSSDGATQAAAVEAATPVEAAPVEAAPVEAAPVEAPAADEAPAPKKRPSRSRKKAAEPEAAAPAETVSEPVAATPVEEPAAEEAPAEPVSRPGVEVITDAVPEKPKKGWWSRLLK